MNRILEQIHKDHIKLPPNQVKRNNKILRRVVDKIVYQMSRRDRRFAEFYNNGIFFDGSFYNNLKVGEPDEFDLDLFLEIPGTELHEIPYIPGNLRIYLLDGYKNDFNRKFVDQEGYLLANKFRQWFESVVDKTINRFRQIINDEEVNRSSVTFGRRKYKFNMIIHKHGPASDLELKCVNADFKINIDLVPCLYFNEQFWPHFINENPVKEIPGFFLAPKEHKDMKKITNLKKRNKLQQYWRLSFQQQEREIILGKNRLKPCLRLFKLLRDRWNHKSMASYYLKTFFMNLNASLSEAEMHTFWNRPLGEVFMVVLKEYIYTLQDGIYDYWDENYNYLVYIDPKVLREMTNTMQNIYKKLKNNPDNPEIIYKCFNLPFER